MIENIDEHYQRIANSINESITDDWTSAKLEVVFFSQSSEYAGEYIREEDGKHRGFPVGGDAGRAFRSLRKEFKAAGKPLWGRATFELDNSGKFHMEWDYENCDENGDAIFDEEIERAKSMAEVDRLTRVNQSIKLRSILMISHGFE